MQREAKIHCLCASGVDRIAEIAFTSGKNCCGLIMSDSDRYVVFVNGKHSDAVRVYNALKANGILIVYTEGV